MSNPATPPTTPPAADGATPPAAPEVPPPPQTPGQESGSATPAASTSTPPEDSNLSREDALAALAAARKEAARYRTERNDLRGAATKWNEHEEAQKTELQRAQEAAAKAQADLDAATVQNTILTVASTYGIRPEDLDLLGTGTAEQVEERAQKLKALYDAQTPGGTPPPSQRPHESFTPGAGDKQTRADDYYPSAWTPKAMRTTS